MERYRPKQYVMYFYGTEHKACISCYPQSRWVLVSKSNDEVTLSNKQTTININVEDFEKHWEKVKEKAVRK